MIRVARPQGSVRSRVDTTWTRPVAPTCGLRRQDEAMRGRSGFVTVAALAILLAVGGTTLVGCDAGPPTGPVKAGYKAGSLGSAEVVGYLSRSDLEGGSWVVYSLPTTSSVAPPNVLAVLLPGSVDEGGMAALDG